MIQCYFNNDLKKNICGPLVGWLSYAVVLWVSSANEFDERAYWKQLVNGRCDPNFAYDLTLICWHL